MKQKIHFITAFDIRSSISLDVNLINLLYSSGVCSSTPDPFTPSLSKYLNDYHHGFQVYLSELDSLCDAVCFTTFFVNKALYDIYISFCLVKEGLA